MNFNFNFFESSKKLEDKLNQALLTLTNLEQKMATVQEILETARAQQDVIKAAVDSINVGIAEVRKLLAANDTTGADALLAEMAANSEALVAATFENTEVASIVDAANG